MLQIAMSGKILAGIVGGIAAVLALTTLTQGEQQAAQGEQGPALSGKPNAYGVSPKRKDKLVLSDAEWRKKLTKKQYEILRAKGTEPAFCGLMHDSKEKGTYYCIGCDLPLFKSDSKFISGTGWPSFFQPATPDAIWVKKDYTYNMVRDEVLCARCDGHLGHVFDDGPAPTGLRFCMNSEVLRFEKTKPEKQLTDSGTK